MLQFPYQLPLLLATWGAVSGRIAGHDQVLPGRMLWSVSEVCVGFATDR